MSTRRHETPWSVAFVTIRRAPRRLGRATLQQVTPDEYPHLARVAREFIEAGTEYGAGFEFGLELILDGIERARAEAGPRDGPLRREAPSTGPG